MTDIRENVPLSSLTTFGIGGNARYFADVQTESELREAIDWALTNGKRFEIISGGSNVLVPDSGVDALIVRMGGNQYEVAAPTVSSWAGTTLLRIINELGKQGLGGWEKLAGIPGSIGGAVRGNAGAFGSEIKDFIDSVEALNSHSGENRTFSCDECAFSYRHSFFKDHPEWIVTRVQLRLIVIPPQDSERMAQETIAEREKRHLQNVRAAGSYFMNPVASPEIVKMFEDEKGVKSREGRVPAGWLIEKAGLKGASVGSALSSRQHADYIVNTGSASAAEVMELATRIKGAVKSMFDIELQEEPTLL